MANAASYQNVLNGTETTQALILGTGTVLNGLINLPSGSTINGRPIGGGGTNVVSVSAGATSLTVTAALHAGKVIVLNNTAPITITMPAATGTGDTYEFFVNAAATATSSVINAASATDVMLGFALSASTTVKMLVASATSAVIQLNGGSQGGVVGDTVKLKDVAASVWSALLFVTPNTTPGTNFVHG